VTFAPRTYGMTSKNGGVNKYPGGLTTSLGVHVVGNGVTFYNYGPAGAVTFALTGATLGGISLTAPTSEPYEGILCMQDPENTSQATILGCPAWNTMLEGHSTFQRRRWCRR